MRSKTVISSASRTTSHSGIGTAVRRLTNYSVLEAIAETKISGVLLLAVVRTVVLGLGGDDHKVCIRAHLSVARHPAASASCSDQKLGTRCGDGTMEAGTMVARAIRVLNSVPYVVAAQAGLLNSVGLPLTPLTIPRNALSRNDF